MPFTDEQRRKAVETRARNKAAREEARLAGGNASATAVAEPEPPTDEPSSEDVLSKLAGLFQQASSESRGREKAITEALSVLGKLDVRKYPDIANNQTVLDFVEQVQSARAESSDVPPGTILGTGIAAYKKPWTRGWLEKGKDLPPDEAQRRGYIPWVMYRPIRAFDVTYQGIRIIWPARREGYFPKSHVDVFEEGLNAEEFAEQHAAWLFHVPGVPYNPAFGGTNAPQVRAMDQSQGEYYNPGGGVIDLTPDPHLVALGGTGQGEGEEES